VTTFRALFPGPLGDVIVSSDGVAITGLHFAAPGDVADGDASADVPCIAALRALLARYWAGEQVRFDVPLALRGTTFQTNVWRALVEIPYGDTITYAELARRVRAPRAVRAVGRANGANPIAIVLPCHRVIGSNGALTGYGGGMDRKRALLELEGAL
jgi:methylated-DNA-[protein]-cysteine S-methyltransferase